MMSLKHRRDASGSASPGPSKSPKVVAECDKADPSSSSSSNRSDADEAARSSSLAGFKRLPQELRTAILEMACYSPFESGNGRSQLRLDTKMVANLALVSREFNSTFNPLLYRQVSLDRPSKLNSFYQSLLSSPANAQHVESLHLGPLTDLPEGWWPISNQRVVDQEETEDDYEPYRIKTSLNERDEHLRLLPRWAKPGSDFAYRPPMQSCQEGAVFIALRAAFEAVGVDPFFQMFNWNDRAINIDDWTRRLFEAQAVLDLYLGAMRRADENKSSLRSDRFKRNARKDDVKCHWGKCGHYPRLVLEGFEHFQHEYYSNEGRVKLHGGPFKKPKEQSKKKGADENHFTVTRDQVLQHLARPGSTTDHFDHPLLYARSDLRMLDFSIWNGEIIIDYKHENQFTYYDDFDAFLESLAAGRAVPENSSAAKGSSRRTVKPLDPAHRPGLIGIARAVLDLTTEVKNLSLTSYFNECIQRSPTGQAQPALLNSMLYLSIGPLSPTSDVMHCLASLKLPNLEKLRFCGDTPGRPTARQMAGMDEDVVWPSLRTIQWEFGHSGVSWIGAQQFIIHILDILQGRPVESEPRWTIFDRSPNRDESENRSPSPAQLPPRQDQAKAHPAQTTHRRSIAARLPQDLVAYMLRYPRHPHPPEIRAAWKDGLPVDDAPHVVKVVRTEATRRTGIEDTPDSDEDELMVELNDKDYEQDVEVLREESRAWWEKRALECRKGRQ